MAKKNQKFRKYSPVLKEKIINEYLNGPLGECNLAQKYKIPRETIKNWIRKTEKGIDVKVLQE